MAARRCVTGDILVEVMKVPRSLATAQPAAKERLSSVWNFNLSTDAGPAGRLSVLSLKFQNYKGYRLQAVSGQNRYHPTQFSMHGGIA
jgi:hypothetical protein